ncbi:hypothetical protein A4G27_05460 [Mycobacterium kansasii]|nr:hypothetical protein A4G27_05460 [Mycobacterium kansasii]
MFGTGQPLPDLDEELEFIEVEDCAKRMNITEEQLRVLIRRGAIATRPDGWAGLLARPTIVV